jgi:hypothetical protein
MTKAEFRNSISTGKLQLTTREKLKHFEPIIFIFIVFLFLLFLCLMLLFNSKKSVPTELPVTAICVGFVTLVLYKLQKRRLKFKTVTSSLNRKKTLQIIEKVANDLEWTIYHNKNNVILAETHPEFLSGSWGEQITILLDRNKIFVNSICALHKRTSMVSMGRNRQNMNTLIYEIQKANS